jgi:DNA-binding PadR family transcriptional regulator
MSTFSDSPGAIYPALRRLQRAGLVRGQVEGGPGSRRRQVFRLTSTGTAALKKWLTLPIEHEDVVRRMEELSLRFAFMDLVVGKHGSIRFLKSLERELKAYVPTLRQYLESTKSQMRLSSRLALESGIRGYETRLRWAREAVSAYEKEV